MLFSQDLIFDVLEGVKDESRRLQKPGDVLEFNETHPERLRAVYRGGRQLYRVGAWYPVQLARPNNAGRGGPALARFRIIDIHPEALQEISDEALKREGFGWLPFDRRRVGFAELWNRLHRDFDGSWQANPDVYAIRWAKELLLTDAGREFLERYQDK